MVPKPKKPQTKRQTLKHKAKVDRRVKEHHRKQRREARKNPNQRKSLKKDPGIPNLHPFKDQLVRKMQQEQETLKENERIRQKRAWQIAERRKLNGNSSNQLSDMMSDAQARQNKYEALQERNRQHEEEGINLDSLSATNAASRTRRAFFKELRKVVEKSDIILEVLDARDPLGSRSHAVEKTVLQPVDGKQKRLVFVLNKIDMVPAEAVQKWLRYLRQFHNTIAFKASTQEQNNKLSAAHGARVGKAAREGKAVTGAGAAGAETILQAIKNYSRAGDKQLAVTVGIIGYPNVGKSSLINSLRRHKAAGVSPRPGKTTNMQEIVLDSKVKLLDCPGIIFDSENDVRGSQNSSASLLLRNCISVDQIEDPELAVMGILDRCDWSSLMKIYSVPKFDDVGGFLASIAHARGKLGKGGVPDKTAAAKLVLEDWNSGRIPFYTLPPEDKDNDTFDTDIVEDWSKEFDIEALERGDTDKYMVLKPSEPSNNEMLVEEDESEEEESIESDDEDMEEDESSEDEESEDEQPSKQYAVAGKKSKASKGEETRPKQDLLDEDERRANPQSELSLRNQEMKKQSRKLRKEQNRLQRKEGTAAEANGETAGQRNTEDSSYDFDQFF
eukprot:gb/GECG01014980.1/.p1 GENE.gb/GECG01014980.1/~~gb/GECG01014980.1/.p1  ORF type:complete len:615 (+),score=125.35 gb/GECG01014980.1/:1-1845(+)